MTRSQHFPTGASRRTDGRQAHGQQNDQQGSRVLQNSGKEAVQHLPGSLGTCHAHLDLWVKRDSAPPHSLRGRQLDCSQCGAQLSLSGTVETVSGCRRPQATHPRGGGSRLGVQELWGGLYLRTEGVPLLALAGLGGAWWCGYPRKFLSFGSTHTLAGELCQGWQPLKASLIFKSIQVISI